MAQEQRRTEHTQQGAGPRPRRSHRKKSAGAKMGFALLYIIMIVGVSVILACVGWVAANDMLALNKEAKEITITITSEDSFGDVVNRLGENDLIEYKLLFRLFAAFTGGEKKISAGTFTLNTDMDYRALISGMSANSSTRANVTVTIPEGYTVEQIFQLLEDKGVATVEDLNEEAANYDYAFSFLRDIPLGDPTRLEGYLYPDTYEFYTPNDPRYAINRMLVNFDSKFTDEMRQAVTDSGYSVHEMLTIAAMIEKETDGTDRAKIASVIYNRLNNPGYETAGYLNIDATILYATGQQVTQYDRDNVNSPYNTFLYKGLPPGPIANPGMESIQAAMQPESTDLYYYALGDDGLHHFYKTYAGLQEFLGSQALYQNN